MGKEEANMERGRSDVMQAQDNKWGGGGVLTAKFAGDPL